MRSYYREQPRQPQPRRSGTKRRVLLILGISVGLALILNEANEPGRRTIEPPPIERSIGRMSAGTLQDYATERGAVAGLLAAEKALAELPEDQRDDLDDPIRTVRINVPASEVLAHTPLADRLSETSRPVADEEIELSIENIRSSAPSPIRERALQDAIRVARDELAKELRAMDPPITHVPSTREIRARYLVLDSVTELQPSPEVRAAWDESGIEPNSVWVEINVELTHDDLRELRADSRLRSTSGIGISILVLLAALTGFLRIDNWTRGYLTKFLALVAFAIAGGGVAMLYLMW